MTAPPSLRSPAIAMPAKLSAEKAKVFEFLAEHYSEDFGFMNFAAICDGTGLDRKRVRRACRFLARKGLAEYSRGLWSDDGEPAGSGYSAKM